MRRRAGVLVAFTLLLGACGRLGVGIPGCPTAVTQPGTALVLSLQAVPSAEYAPCVNEVKFGWSGPRFDAERGLAETRFFNRDSNFLTARLTESCEIGPATPVESDLPGVERFEDIASVPSHLGVVIVPAGEDQLGYARRIVSEHEDTVVRDRVLRFRINQAFESSMRERAARPGRRDPVPGQLVLPLRGRLHHLRLRRQGRPGGHRRRGRRSRPRPLPARPAAGLRRGAGLRARVDQGRRVAVTRQHTRTPEGSLGCLAYFVSGTAATSPGRTGYPTKKCR